MSSPTAGETPRLIQPRRLADDRGWLEESYNAKRFADLGVPRAFVQDNHVCNIAAFTVRGLHAQAPPHDQAKLVRCLAGAILDVAVDLRAGSPTYGKWCGAELSSENGAQLYVPAGFAHGYLTLVPETHVAYKLSAHHAPHAELGLAWDDPAIAIPWPLAGAAPHLSNKDRAWPPLDRLASPFAFDGAAAPVGWLDR